MGLKLKAGIFGLSIGLSYFFGLSGLMGIASHLDSTGNVLVDIADGIGLVSKGIEALENWIDPNNNNLVEEQATTNLPTIEQEKLKQPEPEAAVKPLICKKGKCQPYDPSKDRVLQQQLIKAERERILQQIHAGKLPADTALPTIKALDDDDDADEDDRGVKKAIKAKLSPPPPIQSSSASSSDQATPPLDIVDPANPVINSGEKVELHGLKLGAKRMLSSFANICQRINQLLLKVVAKVFPWNRRAKRRLQGEDQEE